MPPLSFARCRSLPRVGGGRSPSLLPCRDRLAKNPTHSPPATATTQRGAKQDGGGRSYGRNKKARMILLLFLRNKQQQHSFLCFLFSFDHIHALPPPALFCPPFYCVVTVAGGDPLTRFFAKRPRQTRADGERLARVFCLPWVFASLTVLLGLSPVPSPLPPSPSRPFGRCPVGGVRNPLRRERRPIEEEKKSIPD